MKRFFSSLLYLFLGLPLCLSALLLIGIRPWVLDREVYKKFVTDDALYATLRSPEIVRETQAEIDIGGVRFHGPSLIAAAQRELPEPELKKLGAQAVDSVFEALEAGREARVEVDLKPLKDSLRKAVPAVASAYVDAAPRVKELPPPGDMSSLPEAASDSSLEKSVSAALGGAIDGIPDMARENAESRRDDRVMDLSKQALNRALLANTALSLVLIAGLALMAGGGTAAVLARAGSMLGFPSALVMILGIGLAIPGAAILERFIPPEAREIMGAGAREGLRDYFERALGPIARSFFFSGLGGLSLAGLLKSLRRIFEPREL